MLCVHSMQTQFHVAKIIKKNYLRAKSLKIIRNLRVFMRRSSGGLGSMGSMSSVGRGLKLSARPYQISHRTHRTHRTHSPHPNFSSEW